MRYSIKLAAFPTLEGPRVRTEAHVRRTMLLPLWGTQEQGRSMARICGIRAGKIPNAQLGQQESWSKCVDVSGLFPLNV